MAFGLQTNISLGRLATLLGGVNKKIYKVNYINLFLFFLTVLFCCNVGVNSVNISVGNCPLHKLYSRFSRSRQLEGRVPVL